MPVPELMHLHTSSAVYSMGRVDESGRIPARSVIQGLGWSQYDRLSIDAIFDVLVVQRSHVGGTVNVPARACLRVSSGLRARCAIEPGQSVLLVGLPSHDLALAYPEAVIDRMLLQFHTQPVDHD